METSWWSKIKWFVSIYRDLKKNTSPRTIAGTRIIIASIASPVIGVTINLILPPNPYLGSIEITSSGVSLFTSILGFMGFVLGSGLILFDIRAELNQARKAARVIISGLPSMPTHFPSDILSKSEQQLSREPIELCIQDNNTEKQVQRYNAEVCVDLFKRFVLHDKCEKLYIGGLARIPFLVAYGALLRNASNIFYFDKIHGTDSWRLLNDEDLDIKLCHTELLAEPNETGGIGIALGLSTEIHKIQLPISLQNSTNFISTDTKVVRNLILNQENLKRISGSLLKSIDSLSANPNVKKIHFFLSVQSTLAIELGRRYQEGTHKPWVIHNFDGKTGKYAWSLELSSDGVIFQEHKSY